MDGKISALLELGAGFNQDYTGIENIYMNGTMMGFSKKEMDEKLPDILEFADIGDFVYQPVKTYSSGMFVRLAFALSINVEQMCIRDSMYRVNETFAQVSEDIGDRSVSVQANSVDFVRMAAACLKN